MKVRYEFVNGEISEIEVDDNLGELLVDFDRQEYNNDHKETRRHTSSTVWNTKARRSSPLKIRRSKF